MNLPCPVQKDNPLLSHKTEKGHLTKKAAPKRFKQTGLILRNGHSGIVDIEQRHICESSSKRLDLLSFSERRAAPSSLDAIKSQLRGAPKIQGNIYLPETV
jgi:hypothetical protein